MAAVIYSHQNNNYQFPISIIQYPETNNKILNLSGNNREGILNNNINEKNNMILSNSKTLSTKQTNQKRVNFIDKISNKKLVDIVNIESFKEYNIMEEPNPSSKNNCCIIL